MNRKIISHYSSPSCKLLTNCQLALGLIQNENAYNQPPNSLLDSLLAFCQSVQSFRRPVCDGSHCILNSGIHVPSPVPLNRLRNYLPYQKFHDSQALLVFLHRYFPWDYTYHAITLPMAICNSFC